MSSTPQHSWLETLDPAPEEEERAPGDLPESQTATYNSALHGEKPDWRTASRPGTTPTPHKKADETDATLPPPRFRSVRPETDAPVSQYALHHVIASGGFGEIWEATQESLGRLVAVKRLKQGLIDTHRDDPEYVRQLETAFRQEALVAACLEHPNILPVHDLGVDEFGHLLLATKLVRGKPWSEILDGDEGLSTAEFLDRHLAILVSVAQAVAFAHSRGIVHRDLKPSQVMVGEFGEVLLMDWGIAMFLRDDPQPAPAGWPSIPLLAPTPATASNPAGTAVYMAPEQTEATVGNIGPWTDIYLLGGILYELLTGTYPHAGGSHRQSFARAARGFVAAPWDVAPQREIPDELAAICMTCLDPAPARRIKSVETFMTMLQDYRTGASRRREAEGIIRDVGSRIARARDYDSLSYCEELMSRALTLWPGHSDARRLGEGLALRHAELALEKRDLNLARVHAGRLEPDHPRRAELMDEVDRLEEEEARVRQRLEEAYRRADRLVTFLLEDLHESLKEVNRLDVMARLGREAMEYFESFPDEEPTVEHLHKRALACRNIGDVFKQQGGADDAETAFRNFNGLCRRLAELEPEEAEWRHLLAESLERLGSIKYLQGRMKEGEELLDEALAETGRAMELRSGDIEDRWLLARIEHEKGISLWRRRELRTALELHARALGVLEELAAAHPDRTDIGADLGWTLSTLGNVHRDLGELDSAISITSRAMDVRRALHKADPEDKSRLDDVGWSASNMALLLEYSGDFEGALSMFAEAEGLRRRLFSEDPSNAAHRNTMAFILSSRGRILYGLERYDEAAKAAREAVGMTRPLVRKDSSNLRELGGHALSVAYAALCEFALGRFDAARVLLAEAEPLAKRAVDAVPENGVFQNALSQTLLLEGLLATMDGDSERARKAWNTAAQLLDKQTWRTDTGQGAGLHLELCLHLGRVDDARKDAERLREKRWMLPRWESLLAGTDGQ